LTSEQQHTSNITLGQFGWTAKTHTYAIKKLKHPQRTKKMNFYGNRTSGTFGVAATLQANPMATPKEPLFAHALTKKRILGTCF
jgi:hypothetical protein